MLLVFKDRNVGQSRPSLLLAPCTRNRCYATSCFRNTWQRHSIRYNNKRTHAGIQRHVMNVNLHRTQLDRLHLRRAIRFTGSTLDLYFVGFWFESQPRFCLFLLIFIVVYVSPTEQMSSQELDHATSSPSKSSQIHHPSDVVSFTLCCLNTAIGCRNNPATLQFQYNATQASFTRRFVSAIPVADS